MPFLTAPHKQNANNVLQLNSSYYKPFNQFPDYNFLEISGFACYSFLRHFQSIRLSNNCKKCIFSRVIHPPLGKSVPAIHISDSLNEENIIINQKPPKYYTQHLFRDLTKPSTPLVISHSCSKLKYDSLK